MLVIVVLLGWIPAVAYFGWLGLLIPALGLMMLSKDEWVD